MIASADGRLADGQARGQRRREALIARRRALLRRSAQAPCRLRRSDRGRRRGSPSCSHRAAAQPRQVIRKPHRDEKVERQASALGAHRRAGKVRNSTPQPDWEPHTGPVPILEYHVLGDAPADEPYPELYVRRPDFHRQMDWLDGTATRRSPWNRSRKPGTTAARCRRSRSCSPSTTATGPHFTFALPELRKHGWAGVLNLKAEGSDLYESNVKAMIAAGWELAAHTIHHLDLTDARRRRSWTKKSPARGRSCAANTASR